MKGDFHRMELLMLNFVAQIIYISILSIVCKKDHNNQVDSIVICSVCLATNCMSAVGVNQRAVTELSYKSSITTLQSARVRCDEQRQKTIEVLADRWRTYRPIWNLPVCCTARFLFTRLNTKCTAVERFADKRACGRRQTASTPPSLTITEV